MPADILILPSLKVDRVCSQCLSGATRFVQLRDERGQRAGAKYFCDAHGPADCEPLGGRSSAA